MDKVAPASCPSNQTQNAELDQLVQELEIREQKLAQAERMLAASWRRLQKAEEVSHLGSWEMEIATGGGAWSDEFYKICGLAPGEVPPTAEEGFKLIHPDDRERAAQEVSRAIESGGNYNIEKRIVRPSGEIRYVQSVGEILLDQNGKPERLMGSFLDITERKIAENKLQKTLKQLERSNAELEQFAYVASHDLQEPLRTITSYLDLIERRYGDQLDAKGRHFIARAAQGAERMKMLIEDLLTLSRVVHQPQPFAEVDCEEVLSTVLSNLETSIKDTGAEITRDPMPKVIGVAALLHKLFQNLISNALKFQRPEVPPRVHISSRQDGEFSVFSIQDNGIGIDQRFVERIFLIFQRLHSTREHKGTGIGLSICQKVVEHHYGRIWVESEVGKGSTFYFTLRTGGEG